MRVTQKGGGSKRKGRKRKKKAKAGLDYADCPICIESIFFCGFFFFSEIFADFGVLQCGMDLSVWNITVPCSPKAAKKKKNTSQLHNNSDKNFWPNHNANPIF